MLSSVFRTGHPRLHGPRRLAARIVTCAALGLAGNTLAGNAPADEDPALSLGVYFDAQGTQCEGTIGAGEVGRVYIVAKYGPPRTDGIAGAEFRFVGVPDTWQVSAVPNPEIFTLGNPFGDGVVAGFACPAPQARKYVLYEVLVQAGDVQENVQFSLEVRRPPINASLNCPILVQCDAPAFTQFCVEAEPCFVNATKATPCSTPVGVSRTTWGAVKSLLR